MSRGTRWGGDDRELARIQSALTEAHGFLPAALPTNRNGQLTDGQKRRIAHNEYRVRVVAFGIAVVVAAGTGVYFVMQVIQGGLDARGVQRIPAIWLGVAAVLFFIERRWRKVRGELDAGEVHAVSYRAKGIAAEGDDNVSYSYDLGFRRFTVNEKQYRAMIEGPVYRCFYLPRSHTLVNIEVLRDFESRCRAEILAHIP